MVRASTHRDSLLAAAALVVLLNPLAASMCGVTNPDVRATRFILINIVYVAANLSSHQVYCRMYNRGSENLALIYITVDGVLVNTTDPLPTLMGVGEYYTCAFTYEGPWEGSVEIAVSWKSRWDSARVRDYSTHTETVDLEKASGEPVGEAFSTAPTWRDTIFWTPTGGALINQAKDRLGLAQDAYANGKYEVAVVLAHWALSLMNEALEAEQTFETGRNAVFTTGAVFTTLVLLRKRLGLTVEARWFSRHPYPSMLLLLFILTYIAYYLYYLVGVSGAF